MKKKGTKNITYVQRLQIETLFNAKHNNQEIAQMVGLSLRTIQRELKRGEYEHLIKHDNFWTGPKYKKVKKYSAQKSQERYNILNTAKGRPLKVGNDYKFINYINNRVKNERITAHAVWGDIGHKGLEFDTQISRQTLYNYMKLGLIQNRQLGTTKRKKHKE